MVFNLSTPIHRFGCTFLGLGSAAYRQDRGYAMYALCPPSTLSLLGSAFMSILFQVMMIDTQVTQGGSTCAKYHGTSIRIQFEIQESGPVLNSYLNLARESICKCIVSLEPRTKSHLHPTMRKRTTTNDGVLVEHRQA